MLPETESTNSSNKRSFMNPCKGEGTKKKKLNATDFNGEKFTHSKEQEIDCDSISSNDCENFESGNSSDSENMNNTSFKYTHKKYNKSQITSADTNRQYYNLAQAKMNLIKIQLEALKSDENRKIIEHEAKMKNIKLKREILQKKLINLTTGTKEVLE